MERTFDMTGWTQAQKNLLPAAMSVLLDKQNVTHSGIKRTKDNELDIISPRKSDTITESDLLAEIVKIESASASKSVEEGAKIALALLLILSLPLEAAAMTRPVFITDTLAMHTTSQRWAPFEQNGVNAIGASEEAAASPAAIGGSVNNLTVQLTAAPGAGKSYTFAFYKNGVDQNLTCAIADAATSCTDTGAVSFVATDLLSWHATPAGTPAAANARISATMDGTTAGESMMCGATRTNIAGTQYFGTFGGSEEQTDADARMYLPTGGTIDRLYFKMAGTTSGGTFTTTVYENGIASALAATIPDGSASTVLGSDLTDSLTITTGDLISFQVSSTSAPIGRGVRWCTRWRPTTDGEFPLLAGGATAISVGASRYQESQGSAANATTESITQLVAPIAFTWKAAYLTIEPTPGAGKTWYIAGRVNAATSTLDGTITNGNTLVSDVTDTVSVVANDLINWTTFPTGGPTGTTKLMFSTVSFIDPGTAGPFSGFNLNGIFNLNGWANIGR